MPIQTAEHWDEKARLAEVLAEGMGVDPAKPAMAGIAQLYRQLAEQTRNLTAAGDGRN